MKMVKCKYDGCKEGAVGYGDFVPRAQPICKLLSTIESFSGLFVTGLFIFTLARKYSAR